MIKRMAPPPMYMEDTSVSVGSPPRRNADDGIDDRLVARDAECNRRAIPSATATGSRRSGIERDTSVTDSSAVHPATMNATALHEVSPNELPF